MLARVKYLNKIWSQFQEVGNFLKLLKASESGGLKLDLKQYLKMVKSKAGSNDIPTPTSLPGNSKNLS